MKLELTLTWILIPPFLYSFIFIFNGNLNLKPIYEWRKIGWTSKKISEIIDSKLKEIDGTTAQRIKRIQIPYYILIFFALLFAVFFPFFISQSLPNIYFLVPIIPIGVIVYFKRLSEHARQDLREEVKKADSSESEITRIIDKYSGIVDGIGTALPLIGAAILLGIVGSGIKGGNFDQYFTGFAVPFEVVSIAVLASAKLFESVFDELSLNYQEVIDHTKSAEKKYYHDIQIEAITNSSLNNKIPLPPVLSPEQNEEIRKTYSMIQDVLNGLNNETVVKALEQLILLTSTRKDNNL